ncbi:hypothetical protein [Nocardia sp. NPDC048505]|uniref:hypothetical protein n=1 Tax=unclassified Nocardia TaxID=2637762 RepID=UPI0033C51E20
MTIETSRADIATFQERAAAGSVHFDPAAARRCAEMYQHEADRLVHLRRRLESLADLQGFGGFGSARELQAGFGAKARDAAELLDNYIEAAYAMQAAFLTSAGLYEEADAANAAAMRALEASVRA